MFNQLVNLNKNCVLPSNWSLYLRVHSKDILISDLRLYVLIPICMQVLASNSYPYLNSYPCCQISRGNTYIQSLLYPFENLLHQDYFQILR